MSPIFRARLTAGLFFVCFLKGEIRSQIILPPSRQDFRDPYSAARKLLVSKVFFY